MRTPTQSRSTGKERDTETGLDYFGARYYGSNMGRWMSPDWSAVPIAVPYADLSDPQTLNLYGYIRNAPLNRVDVDGHCPPCLGAVIAWSVGVELGLWGAGTAYFDIKKWSADASYQKQTGQLYIDANRNPNDPAYAPLNLDHLAQQWNRSKIQTVQDGVEVGSDINALAGKGNRTTGTGTTAEKVVTEGVTSGVDSASDALKATTNILEGQEQKEGALRNVQPGRVAPPSQQQSQPPQQQAPTPKVEPPACISKSIC